MHLDQLRRLDADLLLTLDALLAESNVTRAAQRLGVRQSAMSARLARLREIFDDWLFLPSPDGRGVLATTGPSGRPIRTGAATTLRA